MGRWGPEADPIRQTYSGDGRMKLSKQVLGFLTLILILGAVAVGSYVLPSNGEGGAEADTSSSPEETVALPAEAAQQFATDVAQPVVGAEVVRDTLWVTVRASGQAASVQGATVYSRVDAIVREIAVSENQAVAEGDLLVAFDTTEYGLALARAQAGLVEAQARFQEMTLFDDEITDPGVREERARLARARSGLAQADVTLREAQINMERTQVRAPFSGRVADLRVVPGQHAGAGTELMTVVSMNPIKVELNVLEQNIGYVREGRRASVTFAAFPDETFQGRVISINPVVDSSIRTGRVTLLLDNPQGRIKPGMYADAAVEAQYFPDRILVPRTAILEKEHRTMLFVFEDGRAKWRYVTVGEGNDTQVEIVPNDETEMVEPGEIVLVYNHFYIHHDARVELVESVPGAIGGMGR
jgi:RND family efflux transporter MFP subunit